MPCDASILLGSSTQPHSRSPKLEPFTDVIDAILEGDLGVPRKQRHTVQRIFGRLRDEYGGQYTILKDYVREHCRQSRQMFGPLRQHHLLVNPDPTR